MDSIAIMVGRARSSTSPPIGSGAERISSATAHADVRREGRWVLDRAYAIWSPFILEGLMRAHGWRLADRFPVRAKDGAAKVPEHVFEGYRFRGRAA